MEALCCHVAVVRNADYVDAHPSEALLIVEVSGESIAHDRKGKLAAYARARVPEYWIVDVTTMSVEVYTKPARARYARKQRLRDGDILRPVMLPGIEIRIADLPR